MTTLSTEDPQFQSAIEACVLSLRRMTEYELDSVLSQRMHDLGERKEYLSQEEHHELLALVDFSHKRTIEKLEAQAALARLRAALPRCPFHKSCASIWLARSAAILAAS